MLTELSGCATSHCFSLNRVRFVIRLLLVAARVVLWLRNRQINKVDSSEEMMPRSPVRRRAPARKKTESEPLAQQRLNTMNDVFLAPKQGQGHTKASVGAPEGSRSDDTESGRAGFACPESDSASVSVGKSPNHAGESPSDRNKQVHKLDDQAFKPFGTRSRASSEAGSDASFCCAGGLINRLVESQSETLMMGYSVKSVSIGST